MSDTIDHLTHLEQSLQEALERLHQFRHQSQPINTPQDLESLERTAQSICLKIADLTTAIVLQHALDSAQLRNEGKELIHSLDVKRICKGLRPITIRFSGGSEIIVRASYWTRKQFEGRRGKGICPELCLLGVHHGCSPMLAGRIALASSSLGSFEESRQTLADHGCHLDIKTIIRVTKALGKYARLGCQNQSLQHPTNQDFQGRNVVVAVDGGRVRIRKPKRGPKTKKKRTRYTTYWKEPKLLIVYISRPDGRIDRGFLPLIDGTLKGPDALFALLYRHLCLLNIGNADQILFVADGAQWIWKRIRLLRALFQLKGMMLNISELIDFYHAAQHLYAFSALKRGWSEKERKQWVNKQKRALKQGRIADVIVAMQAAGKGSKSKQLRRELRYFLKNRHRFAYDQIRALGLPMGSGAIESAIRRVINLRLKSPCLYWTQETAEEMILLRSYYKSGRWDQIKTLSNQGVLACAA